MLWRCLLQQAAAVGIGVADDVIDGKAQGLGDTTGHFADGDGAVVGLDEHMVEWGGLQRGGIEPQAVGEVATGVEQGACDMLIAPHPVDGQRHVVEVGTTSAGEDVLRSPDVVDDDRQVELPGQLQVTREYRLLDVGLSAPGVVYSRLADGEHLFMAGA